MTKIKSSQTIEWPKLKFSIQAGEIKDLPADKAAATVILKHESVKVFEDKLKA